MKATIPVTKNGKFFGYADEDQIANNPALKIFDKKDTAPVEEEAAPEEPASGGANPDDVRKSENENPSTITDKPAGKVNGKKKS